MNLIGARPFEAFDDLNSNLSTPNRNPKQNRPSGQREGYQTIRACSTNVKLPLGCEVRCCSLGVCLPPFEHPDATPHATVTHHSTHSEPSTRNHKTQTPQEMVVDVYRMKTKKGAKGKDESGNPLERFSGGCICVCVLIVPVLAYPVWWFSRAIAARVGKTGIDVAPFYGHTHYYTQQGTGRRTSARGASGTMGWPRGPAAWRCGRCVWDWYRVLGLTVRGVDSRGVSY